MNNASDELGARDELGVVARTERVSVRRFAMSDAPFVLRLLNDASFLRYIGDRGVRNLSDAENYLRIGPMASYETHGHGLNAVVLRERNVCVGMCGILRRDTLPGPDLGYAFLPEFTGAGLAEEATRAILENAREVFKFPEMLAIVQPDNLASIKLLHKLGFALSETLKPTSADGAALLGFRLALQSTRCEF